ncbi:uncharacterized protein LOC135807825 [Sycon ciliatum]|uniref:uncharacterized protein LOC135807825 n=1 Tax=Sycon ciliatum TaxID=27933 RepID=UPI0031F60BB8
MSSHSGPIRAGSQSQIQEVLRDDEQVPGAECRRSSRSTKGRPPSRYGFDNWSDVPDSVSSAGHAPSKVSGTAASQASLRAEMLRVELEAARQIAELEEEAETRKLARETSLVQRELEVRRAEAESAAALRSGSGSKVSSRKSETGNAASSGRAILTAKSLAEHDKLVGPGRKFVLPPREHFRTMSDVGGVNGQRDHGKPRSLQGTFRTVNAPTQPEAVLGVAEDSPAQSSTCSVNAFGVPALGPVAQAFMRAPAQKSVTSTVLSVVPAKKSMTSGAPVGRTTVSIQAASNAVPVQPAISSAAVQSRLPGSNKKAVSMLNATPPWHTPQKHTAVAKQQPPTPVAVQEHSKQVLNPQAESFMPYPPQLQTLHPASFSFHVKPLELPKFSGKTSDYDRWKQNFRRVVDEDPLTTEAYKLAQLRECLMHGTASDLVDGVLDGPGAYHTILRELDAWYGGDNRTVERQEKEILQWPKLKESDDNFAKFVLRLRTMLMNMEMCAVTPGRELYISVTQKLPKSLLLRYMEKYDDADCDIYQLTQWLLRRVNTLRRADERLRSTEVTASAPAPARSWSKQSATKSERTFVATSKDAGADRSCPSCGKAHQLHRCPDFIKMEVRDRWKVIKSKPDVCALCFGLNHRAKTCTRQPCSKCSRTHHDMLHYNIRRSDSAADPSNAAIKANAASASSGGPAKIATTHCASHQPEIDSGESFMVVPVVFRHNGVSLQGNALLDPASSTSYVQQSVATALNVRGPKRQLVTSGVGGKQTAARREHVQIQVAALGDKTMNKLEAWVLPTVTVSLPAVNWNQHKSSWPHLSDIDFPSIKGSQIDALIGLNAIELHATLEERRAETARAPIARRTPLGWVCIGTGVDTTRAITATTPATDTVLTDGLTELVEKFWRDESAGTDNPLEETPSPDDRRAEELTSQSISCNGNRVTVRIPWVNDSGKPRVRSNRAQAEQRLRSLQRSLQSRPAVKQQYSDVMQKHIAKGYVRRVDPDEIAKDGNDQWYLPHFPVVRSDKSTSKVRIVFDGAARWDGHSINDEMFTGPALQNDMTSVLIRFSLEPVALVGDVSEMFLQVKLAERDQRYHRFLWYDDNGQVQVYQFTRVLFGAKASPYLAGRAVKEVIKHHGDEYDSDVVQCLSKDLYVDDMLSSLPSTQRAIQAREQTQQLLAKGGFHMRKWLSNKAEVMNTIPEEDRSPDVVRDVDSDTSLPTVKTLGVSWNAEKDAFTFQHQMKDITTFTRRSVLRGLASIFDPRGLISPYVITAKVLLQDAWLLGQGWDDLLPKEQVVKWQGWFQGLPDLSNLEISRCFKDPQQPSEDASLSVHCFSDASDRAIAAAVYVRASYPDGTTRITLAMSKAKPAPVRRQTIPQLELRAAVLGVRVSHLVAESIGIPVSAHTFWTDSMNVLGWVQSHSRRYKVDIGNRISELQTSTRAHQWRHVPGKNNPADKGTRGLSAALLCRDAVWWSGPQFLRQQPDEWPQMKEVSTSSLPGQLKTALVAVVPPPSEILGRFSTWSRLVRVTAWCKRFVANCRQAVSDSKSTKGDAASDSQSSTPVRVPVQLGGTRSISVPVLSTDEVSVAERHWIATAQKDCHGTAYHRLQSRQPMLKSDPLAPLCPQFDSATESPLMTVGGRLQATKNMPSGVRHPVILPAKHRVTQLIIEQEDHRCFHAVGPQHLLANLRQRYWIVHGTSTVKAVRSNCVTCRKNRAEPASQMMGQIPDFRVAGSLKPFSRTGVDYAGPFLTKQGRGKTQAKRYLCLFTCLETRACHLEVSYGLSTESFLLAFERFTKRRGVPLEMVSDNGTNFTAAEQELREAVRAMDKEKIEKRLVSDGVRWRFNPPRAPHFGGVFESLIKTAKRGLTAVLGKADVTDEELVTAMCQVEGMMNSRPLTVVSADAADLQPLTPAHFLVGRLDPPMALEVKADEHPSRDPRKRWLYVQRLVADVWNRWRDEYVPLLNVRRKWQRQGRNVAVGDIMLCLTSNTPRGTWPMGRVTAVHPGADKLVRVVDIKIGDKIYRRSIHHLVPILDTE